MKRVSFLIFFISSIVACNNTQTSQSTNDTTHLKKSELKVEDNTASAKTLQADHNNKDSVLKLISDFSESEFRDSRKQPIAEGKEHQYQVSDIVKLGNTLKYDVVIPGIDGKTEYTCNPEHGEIIIIMIGDKDVALMYYNQVKVGLKLPNCNKTDSGEQCESYQDMTDYPIKTHFTISLINQDDIAIYTLKRVLMPK